MSNRDKLLEKILKDDDDISGLIENADESLKADKEIIMAAAKLDGMSLKYADDSLKGDKEVVLAASEEDGWCALKYCSEDLKADRDFVLEIVKKDGSALGEAHESLKADKEIVLAAVMQYGDAFDDDDKVTGIDVRRKNSLVLSAKETSCLHGDFSDDLVLGINNMP